MPRNVDQSEPKAAVTFSYRGGYLVFCDCTMTLFLSVLKQNYVFCQTSVTWSVGVL